MVFRSLFMITLVAGKVYKKLIDDSSLIMDLNQNEYSITDVLFEKIIRKSTLRGFYPTITFEKYTSHKHNEKIFGIPWRINSDIIKLIVLESIKCIEINIKDNLYKKITISFFEPSKYIMDKSEEKK